MSPFILNLSCGGAGRNSSPAPVKSRRWVIIGTCPQLFPWPIPGSLHLRDSGTVVEASSAIHHAIVLCAIEMRDGQSSQEASTPLAERLTGLGSQGISFPGHGIGASYRFPPSSKTSCVGQSFDIPWLHIIP